MSGWMDEREWVGGGGVAGVTHGTRVLFRCLSFP